MKIIGIAGGTGVLKIRGFSAADQDFTLSMQPVQTNYTAPGSTTATVDDVSETSYTISASYTLGAKMDITGVLPSNAQITLSSLTPAIAAVDAAGNVTPVGSQAVQTAIIEAKSNINLKKILSLLIGNITAIPATLYNNFVSGTLGLNAVNNIDNRINPLSNPGPYYEAAFNTATCLFSGTCLYPPSTATSALSFTRSSSHWCHDIDFTCFSPWNSNPAGGNCMAGTLVTPRHLISATHYRLGESFDNPAVLIGFVDASGNLSLYTLIGTYASPGFIDIDIDIRVHILDRPVATGITPAKIMPSGWVSTYIPGIYRQTTQFGANIGVCVPFCGFNQFKQAMVFDSGPFPIYLGASVDALIPVSQPNESQRLAFWGEGLIGGDSGSPCFLLLTETGNSVPTGVLTHCWTSPTNGRGVSYYQTAIQEAINSLTAAYPNGSDPGGGYSLSVANLTGYANFS